MSDHNYVEKIQEKIVALINSFFFVFFFNLFYHFFILIHGDQLNMAVFIYYLGRIVTGPLNTCITVAIHWTSHFFQCARKKTSCLTVHLVALNFYFKKMCGRTRFGTHEGLDSSEGDSGMEARDGSWLTRELIILETWSVCIPYGF